MSGYPDRDRPNAAADSQFLQKPVKPERLAQAIRQVLDNQEIRMAV